MQRLLNKFIMLTLALLIVSTLTCGMLIACAPNKNVTGMILSLEKAYEKELLNSDDLQNIAYYMDCAGDTEFSPKPKNPKLLSETTENAIKSLYLKDIQKEIPEATVKDVSIDAYYGTYGSCIAVRLSTQLIHCDYVFSDEEIGGVTFYNYCDAFVSIVVIDEIGH